MILSQEWLDVSCFPLNRFASATEQSSTTQRPLPFYRCPPEYHHMKYYTLPRHQLFGGSYPLYQGHFWDHFALVDVQLLFHLGEREMMGWVLLGTK